MLVMIKNYIANMQSKEGTLQYIVYGFLNYFDERIFIADEPQYQSPKTHTCMRPFWAAKVSGS
ncbi:MAG: hypothetical protein DYG98_09170 [Haliscomenobacteraceae bacterium CHB4]|nr:hypothetical protein [Saprospiraceae bacterium]MCE7923216.1 hypothetical protein [Haliscomenobacteraceae bacterium CHB4]